MTGLEAEFRHLEHFYSIICLHNQSNAYGISIKATPIIGGPHYVALEGFDITLQSFHDCKRSIYFPWGAIQLMLMNKQGISNEFVDTLYTHMEELDKEDYMKHGI